MTDIKESFVHGLKERISEELPGLTKAAQEMIVSDIVSSIENSEELAAAARLSGMSKEAGIFSAAGKVLGEGVASGLTRAGVGLMAGATVHNFLKSRRNEQLINQYADFQNTLSHVAARNALLSSENEDRIQELGNSIFKFAPTVANDPLVLETVMSNAIHGGGLDPQTVRSLQELEERYHNLHNVEQPRNYMV